MKDPTEKGKRHRNLKIEKIGKKKNLGMTEEKRAGALAKNLLFATPCHREHQG